MNSSSRTLCLATALALLAACQPTWLTSMKVYVQNEQYDQAVRVGEEGLRSEPDNAEAHFYLGVAYSHLDSVAHAYRLFVRSMELDPENPRRNRMVEDNITHNFARHYKLGQSAHGGGNVTIAVMEFGKATEADPRQPLGFFNLGVSHVEMSEHVEAVGAFEKALALTDASDSYYAKTLGALASSLVSLNRIDEAVQHLHGMIDHDASSYAAIESLADGLFQKKHWRAAAAVLEVAADARERTHDEAFSVHYNIALAYSKLRDENPDAAARASEHFEKAHQLDPSNHNAVMSLLGMAMWREDWTEAAQWGEKRVALKPDDVQSWRLLARCYSEVGNKEKARDCLARSQALSEE